MLMLALWCVVEAGSVVNIVPIRQPFYLLRVLRYDRSLYTSAPVCGAASRRGGGNSPGVGSIHEEFRGGDAGDNVIY